MVFVYDIEAINYFTNYYTDTILVLKFILLHIVPCEAQ